MPAGGGTGHLSGEVGGGPGFEPEDLSWLLGPAQPLSSSLIFGEPLEAMGLVSVLVKWRCNCSLPQGIGRSKGEMNGKDFHNC